MPAAGRAPARLAAPRPDSTRTASASQAGTSRGGAAVGRPLDVAHGRAVARVEEARRRGARAAPRRRAAPSRTPSGSAPPRARSRPARIAAACRARSNAPRRAVVVVERGAGSPRRAPGSRSTSWSSSRDVVGERDEVVARRLLDLGELACAARAGGGARRTRRPRARSSARIPSAREAAAPPPAAPPPLRSASPTRSTKSTSVAARPSAGGRRRPRWRASPPRRAQAAVPVAARNWPPATTA